MCFGLSEDKIPSKLGVFYRHMAITLVFFIYGLAFFSMGLALFLEVGRSPLLAESRVLLVLALFGFLHGIHEWLEMAIAQFPSITQVYPPQLSWLRLVLLILSFACLITYGLMNIRLQMPNRARQPWLIICAVVAYILFMIGIGLATNTREGDWLLHVDAESRYLLAVPGAALAAVVFRHQAVNVGRAGRNKLSKTLTWTFLGFGLYSLTQTVVSKGEFFPANSWNTAVFIDLFGIPVQFIRAALAAVITVSLLRAIQTVETERHHQLLEAQTARLEALEQVQHELIEREALQKEFLQHTIRAQEEERRRIARELHDETAQLLTAFSLHLATLRDLTINTPLATGQISRLQELNRQMSQGLYRLVNDLRPAQLDDLGLVAAMQYLCDDQCLRTGLVVNLTVHGKPVRLNSLQETVFYRVAQEALTNVARHSGVERAEVELVFSPLNVQLRISDRGRGFVLDSSRIPSPGWGIAGMRERVGSVGGELRIHSTPGEGTTIEVLLLTKKGEELELEVRIEDRALDSG